jgi:methyl-galactoside transport system substrate-binding protein
MKKLFSIAMVLFVTGMMVFAAGGQQGESNGQPQIGVAIYKFDDTFMSYTINAIQQNAQGKAVVTTVDSQNAQ